MPSEHEIRADYDHDTITVYQALSPSVADAVLAAGRFVAPFSSSHMTWINLSFLGLMYQTNWGRKRGSERILAVRVRRTGFEKALSLAVLTTFTPGPFATRRQWARQLAAAPVHLCWDPERTLRGAELSHLSIRVGLGEAVVREYAEEWVAGVEDHTAAVRRLANMIRAGKLEMAKKELPPERIYPVNETLGRRLLIER